MDVPSRHLRVCLPPTQMSVSAEGMPPPAPPLQMSCGIEDVVPGEMTETYLSQQMTKAKFWGGLALGSLAVSAQVGGLGPGQPCSERTGGGAWPWAALQ